MISKDMKFRGVGNDKEAWFSICSTHHLLSKTCGSCNAGNWVNIRDHFFEGIIYETNERIWKKHFTNNPLTFESYTTYSSEFL